MGYIVKVDDKEFALDLERHGDTFKVRLNNKEVKAEIVSPYQNNQMIVAIDNKIYKIISDAENCIVVNEEEYHAEVFDENIYKLMKTSPEAIHKKELTITVPMPGLVIEVEVKEGDSIKAGQGLVIVEAMKMQNEIKTPRDGIVKKILVQKGQTVNSKDTLIIIE